MSQFKKLTTSYRRFRLLVGPVRQNEKSALAKELRLKAPLAPWHVCRDALAETVGFLGLVIKPEEWRYLFHECIVMLFNVRLMQDC